MSEKYGGRSYPNQTRMTIHKRQWERYAMFGIEEIHEAMKELTHGALKLYIYLGENVHDYTFWFSPADVQRTCNMSKSTYDRARLELINKGYLKQEGNHYHFYANKQDIKNDAKKLSKKIDILMQRIEDEGGDTYKYDKYKLQLEKLKDISEKEALLKEIVEVLDNDLNEIYEKKIDDK